MLPRHSQPRLADQGIALVINRHARRLRKGHVDPRRLRALVELHGRAYEPASVLELRGVAEELRARDPGVVAICGGDGTVQKTLTALIHAYGPHPLPVLLPLPGGTFNVLSTHVRVRGRPEQVLARAIRRLRDDAQGAGRLRTTTVPILAVEEELRTTGVRGDHGPRRREFGFLFGNGVISRAIARYAEGPPSRTRGARVFSEAVGGFMMQTPASRELVRRYSTTMVVDGRTLEDHRILGFLAGTIQPALLGFSPFVGRRRLLHSFHYLIGAVDASQVIGLLPALLRGKLWSATPGLHNATAQEIRFASDEGYILDGEVHPGGVLRDLRITLGPRLRFLRG